MEQCVSPQCLARRKHRPKFAVCSCLVSRAVAKAGDTVLIIEPEDSYGSEFSSCTLDTLEKLLQPALSAPQAAPVAPASAAVGDADIVHLPQFRLPIDGLQCWSLPGADLGARGSYILDLAPKVCPLLQFSWAVQGGSLTLGMFARGLQRSLGVGDGG